MAMGDAAESDAMVDRAVIADLGRFPDDDAIAVVDEEVSADFGARMDLDASDAVSVMHRHFGEKLHVV